MREYWPYWVAAAGVVALVCLGLYFGVTVSPDAEAIWL